MTDAADATDAIDASDTAGPAPLRWGIASTGGIATRMAEALGTLPDAEVVAVGSRTRDAADEFAGRFGIAHAHGSYEALFADDDVDIVYVGSPHNLHHDMTVASLNAGRHVLCEKAFALNAGQARSMVAAATANRRFLMEAMWTWFIPAVVEVKRRVDAGDIGRVLVVDANFGIPILADDARHRRPELAGGALLDLGIYPLSIARFLLGEPDEVNAFGRLTDRGVDALVGGVLTFPSGALATFHSTIDGLSSLDARVVGTEGSIVIEPRFWHARAFTITSGGVTQRVEIPNAGLAHEADHVMRRIRGGHLESDVLPWATSIANMELLDEIRRQIGVVYPDERDP